MTGHLGTSDSDRARRVARLAAVALALAAATQGCASTRKLAYDARELRAEIARRAGVPRDTVPVPFEVDDVSVEIARAAIRDYRSRDDQARALVQIMSSAAGLALSYAPVVTSTAQETLASHRGNCLALASVFVGLARAVGLEAYFIDASERVHSTSERSAGLVVHTGHISAYVEADQYRYYLDFDYTLGPSHGFRVMSDLEAMAHFYDNRGYESIDLAEAEGRVADWAAAAEDFAIAARIQPTFAAAWSNLGVARRRAGDLDGAELAYRRAVGAEPTSATAYNNLASLYLEAGRAESALEAARSAVQLAPTSPHARFNLGRALLASGELEAASLALAEAARLRNDLAGRMLSKLELYRHHDARVEPRPTEP